MTSHHPQEDLLLSYSAGALGESWSLPVACHLAYCSECRYEVSAADEIGGLLLEDSTVESLSPSALGNVLSQLDKVVELEAPKLIPRTSALPSPLREYVSSDIDLIPWKSIGRGTYQCLIATGDSDQARLLRIPAGKPVPEHGHRGRELTLVLRGSFSDQNGEFSCGDLQDVDEDITHQPYAGMNEDCICLAVTDASLKFTNLMPRLAQPFINI